MFRQNTKVSKEKRKNYNFELKLLQAVAKQAKTEQKDQINNIQENGNENHSKWWGKN